MNTGLNKRARATKGARGQRGVQRTAPGRVAEHPGRDLVPEAPAGGDAEGALHTGRSPIRRPQQRHPVTGQFLRLADGEVGAHTEHELRSRTGRCAPEYLAAQSQFLAAALVDEGERPEDIPARRRSLLEYRAILHRKILMLDGALRERGLFHRDKLRVAWLTQLTALIGRAESVDRLLTLARRPRHVGAVDDPAEYLAAQEEATCERG